MPGRTSRRAVDGVLLLDKPEGLTSNAALQEVKRLFKARKAGHTGSLDPLASGLLPICLGEATKVSGFLLEADKSYRFTCRLGVTTTTGDAEGDILERRPVEDYGAAGVEAVLERFRGEIQQLPPMYSALKHQGRRLYQLARAGIEVQRQPRTAVLHELRLLEIKGEFLQCSARCSKGTYIRTLAEDIGKALGCGAHVVALRRTAVVPYDSGRMRTLESVRERAERGQQALDELLLPMDTALGAWSALKIDAEAAYYLRKGQAQWVAGAPREAWLRLYDHQGLFFAIGKTLPDGRVTVRRLFQTASSEKRRTAPPG